MHVCVSVLHSLTTSSQCSKAEQSRGWYWIAVRGATVFPIAWCLGASHSAMLVTLYPTPQKLNRQQAILYLSQPVVMGQPIGNAFCFCFCLKLCLSVFPMRGTMTATEPKLNMHL